MGYLISESKRDQVSLKEWRKLRKKLLRWYPKPDHLLLGDEYARGFRLYRTNPNARIVTQYCPDKPVYVCLRWVFASASNGECEFRECELFLSVNGIYRLATSDTQHKEDEKLRKEIDKTLTLVH